MAAQFETVAQAAKGCDIIVAATALQIAARSVAETQGIPYVFAATKSDKLKTGALKDRLRQLAADLGPGETLVPFSSETGLGKKEMLKIIFEALA